MILIDELLQNMKDFGNGTYDWALGNISFAIAPDAEATLKGAAQFIALMDERARLTRLALKNIGGCSRPEAH